MFLLRRMMGNALVLVLSYSRRVYVIRCLKRALCCELFSRTTIDDHVLRVPFFLLFQETDELLFLSFGNDSVYIASLWFNKIYVILTNVVTK